MDTFDPIPSDAELQDVSMDTLLPYEQHWGDPASIGADGYSLEGFPTGKDYTIPQV